MLPQVHERDISTDFLLVLMKDVLRARPNLRLILMSATLDAAAISEFFGGAPLVQVPSATRFPVKEVYLDELLHILKQPRARAASYNLYQRERQLLREVAAEERDPNDRAVELGSAGEGKVDPYDGTVNAVGPQVIARGVQVEQVLAEHAALLDGIDTSGLGRGNKPGDDAVYTVAAELCAKLARDLLADEGTEAPCGSLLVFLPGMEQIKAVNRHLDSLPERGNMKVIQLHSTVGLPSTRRHCSGTSFKGSCSYVGLRTALRSHMSWRQRTLVLFAYLAHAHALLALHKHTAPRMHCTRTLTHIHCPRISVHTHPHISWHTI